MCVIQNAVRAVAEKLFQSKSLNIDVIHIANHVTPQSIAGLQRMYRASDDEQAELTIQTCGRRNLPVTQDILFLMHY
jgi:hypothetical protein